MPSTMISLISFLAILPLAFAQVQSAALTQAGRVPCGLNSANQTICDTVISTNITKLPVNSKCVESSGGGFFCGFAGASCTLNSECDYGRCLIGQCFGGFGQSCESESNCEGNLQCFGPECTVNACASNQKGSGTCGGIGAGCNYSGNFEASFEPNNEACASLYCDPSSLQCSEPPAPPALGHTGGV